MSEPKDDVVELDVDFTTASCPHCVIIQMMQSLIGDRVITVREAADFAYSALVDVVAMAPEEGRSLFLASVQIALPEAVAMRIAAANADHVTCATCACTEEPAMDDFKLRQGLEEAVARETGPMRALKVLEAMRGTARQNEDWNAVSMLNTGLAEVQAYIAEDAKRPSYQSDREAIERITVQRDNAEAKVAELQRRLAETERSPPSNASAEAMPEPPAALRALVERWRTLSQQRRISLRLDEGDRTDFGQCALELNDVLSKWWRVASVANLFLAHKLDGMTKRAESAEQTLQRIKENLP